MKFDQRILLTQLERLTSADTIKRWLVGFSGGLDSTVLLHALAANRGALPQSIIAVHIDHGLHPDSMLWADHCCKIASDLQIEFICQQVNVSSTESGGQEAAARHARYGALLTLVREGDCVLSAHHEDDQAETLLLNLLRGSGMAGLAGIGSRQLFGAGYLVRPLLDVPLAAIATYAREQELSWIEDPSNDETQFDRNYLRHEVLPVLARRWPAVSSRFRQSADLAAESSVLLQDLADHDLRLHDGPNRLLIDELMVLSEPRQRNLLRRAIFLCGLPPAPASRLYQAVHELIPARDDAQPLVCWNGAELRRYRNHLFVLTEFKAAEPAGRAILAADGEQVELGNGMGCLQLVSAEKEGIDAAYASNGLSVRYRRGGEKIRLKGHNCTHKLKKLLQQDGILPWMRDRLPLLYADEKLVAVADFWIAEECLAQRGLSVRWDNRPALR